MEPVQPANQTSNTVRNTTRIVNPTAQTRSGRYDDAAAAALSRSGQPQAQWMRRETAPSDPYWQGLHDLLDDALADQAFDNANVAVLISALAAERMRDDPDFENRALNSLYNGMQAATYLVIPAYLILKVQDDGTVGSSSSDVKTLAQYEEEAINAFWTRQPVSAGLSSTDSWRMTYERKPRRRRKLSRRRIWVWLERRRRQFLAQRQALYNFLSGLGNQPPIKPEQKPEKEVGEND